ncbi:PHP domain-containing protein [Methanococcus aeolicus]|uniref:PHP domain-containing protein n=1 Tax=Methanococcus aeolicus TaxID=42879 RepID=UPI0021C945F4|nr:PHP-associated domain-containing protein [Methanococcus aeolicus]UXM84249.1 PHP domain-containing protein [Methanococcus aeolicus]
MKIDMHVHTINSRCSINPIKLLKKICNLKKITPITADHNVLTKLDFAIAGEEIATNRGEFIGAFLTEQINEKDIFEAMDKVKEQGGIIYLPHPFDQRRRRALCRFDILHDKEFIKKIDIVEIFNSRCLNNHPNNEAEEYAEKYNILKGVGSDSHFPWEIGNSYMELDEFDKDNPKEFLKSLKNANKFHVKLGAPANILLYSKISKKIHKIAKF